MRQRVFSAAAVLPRLGEGTESPLRWRVEWARIGDDRLSVRFHAELARGELSATETPLFQQQFRALLSSLGASAALNVPAEISKQ